MRSVSLLLAVWATLFLLAVGSGASAAEGRAVEELAFTRAPGGLQVVQIVSTPSGGIFPVLPGARGITVPAGAAAVVRRGGFAAPMGQHFAEVQYTVPVAARTGLVTHLVVPTRLAGLFVLAGPGVSFPIVLNQAFFGRGRTEQLGVTYDAYEAGPVGPGVVPLRLELPASGNLVEWLWLPLTVGLALILFLRRRRHAGAP